MTRAEDVERAKRENLIDKVKKADEALAEALKERVKLGAQAAVAELFNLATFVPGSFPYSKSQLTGNNISKSEIELLRTAPFFTEAYLYNLVGKEDARSILARFSAVCRALGVKDGLDELQAPFFRAQEDERLRQIDILTHQIECSKGEGHTLSLKKPCDVCRERRKQWKDDKYDPSEGCDDAGKVARLKKLKREGE